MTDDGKQNVTAEPTIPDQVKATVETLHDQVKATVETLHDQVKAILKTGWKQTADELPPEGEFVLAWNETIGLYLATWRDLDGVRLWIDCNHEQIDEPAIWHTSLDGLDKNTKEETDGILEASSTAEP